MQQKPTRLPLALGTMNSFNGLAYGTNTFPFNDVPVVTPPVSDPPGASVTYAVLIEDDAESACTVDARDGDLDPTKTGTCEILATGVLANYTEENAIVEVTITEGTHDLEWFELQCKHDELW